MPAVPAPAKVLVSGANGFIAVWVVKRLLEAGYSVRGTARSEGKAVHLRKTFESYGEKFEVVIVPDITQVRAYAIQQAEIHRLSKGCALDRLVHSMRR